MLFLARLRKLGPLLLALVLLAQAVAIAPLISTHLQHASESEQDLAADLAADLAQSNLAQSSLAPSGKTRHTHHHHAHHDGGPHEHGSADPNDQCCTLHNHLAGVLPVAGGGSRSRLTAAIVVVPSPSLASADPGALERPPKRPLPI
jgi:hypothetical protein